MTFTIPSGLGRFCRGRRYIPGFHEDLGPISLARHSATLPMDSGRDRSLRGPQRLPIGTWTVAGGTEEGWAGWGGRQCVGEEQGEEPGAAAGRTQISGSWERLGQRDDWLMISGGAVRAWEIPWLRKVPVSCMLHAEDSGDWAGDRKQPLCQLNLPLLVPESPFKGLCDHLSGSQHLFL